MKRCMIACLCLIWAGPAFADPASGVWLTEPDNKGQVAHVKVYECTRILCGKIIRTFNSAGQQIEHRNVGKLVFWDMRSSGQGTYQGRAFVPAHNREYAGEIRLSGNRMTVRGCLGPICQNQSWTRVD